MPGVRAEAPGHPCGGWLGECNIVRSCLRPSGADQGCGGEPQQVPRRAHGPGTKLGQEKMSEALERRCALNGREVVGAFVEPVVESVIKRKSSGKVVRLGSRVAYCFVSIKRWIFDSRIDIQHMQAINWNVDQVLKIRPFPIVFGELMVRQYAIRIACRCLKHSSISSADLLCRCACVRVASFRRYSALSRACGCRFKESISTFCLLWVQFRRGFGSVLRPDGLDEIRVPFNATFLMEPAAATLCSSLASFDGIPSRDLSC